MTYTSIAVITAYYLIFLLYYKMLCPSSGRRWVQVAFSPILVAAIYIAGITHGCYTAIMVGATLAITFGLRISTGMSLLQAMYGGGMCTISVYCFRGIFTALYLLIFQRGQTEAMQNAAIFYTVTLIALPASLLYFWILRKTILPDHRILRVLRNRKQLSPIVGYQFTVIVFLILINQGRLKESDFQWYLEISLGACVLALGMLIYAIFRSAEALESEDYKWRAILLENQYASQLRHYQMHEKYMEGLRHFKHDFRAVMSLLRMLIHEGENKKALQLIDEMYETMQNSVQLRQKYSDHIVLDAMLQDLVAICEENQIRFSFQGEVPRDTKLSLLDSIRIFSNLTDNATEACMKVPIPERFMSVSFARIDGWETLYIVNSYNGELCKNGKSLMTTKSDPEKHGVGIRAVIEIAERLGGFFLYEGDSQTKTFTACVHIPRAESDR